MTRQRKAQVITLVVLAAALLLIVARRGGWKPAKAELSPQDAVYAMLDAARAGDVDAYLAAHTGQVETALRQSLAESTPERFAKYLQSQNAAIKGIAITEPQPLTAREVKVRVEYVYQDRNEAQFLYLEKTAAGWKIARVDSTERVKTLVPYGTPVQ